MKRKQVMTKIAAVALAAMMTATVVPAAAVPAFAATEATTGTATVTADATITADADNNAILKLLTTKLGLEDENSPKLVNVTSTEATYKDGSIDYGKITGTVSYDLNGVGQDQKFEINGITQLSNKGKVAVAKAYLENYFSNRDAYTTASNVNSSVVESEAKKQITNLTALSGVKVSADVTTTQPSGKTDGKVEGTITVSVDAIKDGDKVTDAAASDTVTISIAIKSDYKVIDQSVADSAAASVSSSTELYNDVTEEQIESAISDWLKNNKYTDTTVDVTFVDNSKTDADHDNSGSIKFTVQLVQGDVKKGSTGTVTTKHSPSDAFAEAETNIAAKAEDMNDTIAKRTAEGTAPSLENVVLKDANKVVENAFNAKVKLANGKDSKTALSNDYGTDKLLKGSTDTTNYNELVTSETVKYTEPTTTKAGTAVVTVKLKVLNPSYSETDGTITADEKWVDKTITFTLTYNKLKVVPATKLELGNATVIEYYNTLKELTGKTVDLKTQPGVTIEGKDGETPNDITWTSDNSDITVDENGVVTATNFGTATITATSATNNLTDTVKVTFARADGMFKDVTDAKTYFFTPVYWAKENGIVYGTSDTMFSPNGNTTRGQMITFLYRYYLKEYDLESVKATETFEDVNDGDYYQEAVAWAQTNGIAAGVSSTEFAPNQNVTRAQLVTFLYRYAQKFSNEYGQTVATDEQGEIKFTDVKATAYYATAVKWAANHLIAAGYVDGTFRPDNDCARKDAVSFLYRARGIIIS